MTAATRTNGRFPAGWDTWASGDLVTVPGKPRGRRYPGEIAGTYAGGVTVFVDGVAGMARPYLYAELRRNAGEAQSVDADAADESLASSATASGN